MSICHHGKIESWCPLCGTDAQGNYKATKPPGRDMYEFSEETQRLAELVIKLPPIPDTPEAIEQWAKRLAADICKGRD